MDQPFGRDGRWLEHDVELAASGSDAIRRREKLPVIEITGCRVQDLPSKFGVSVFVPGATIPRLIESGLPVDGLIDGRAHGGQRKWEGLGAKSVLFRGKGTHSDWFLTHGWSVVPVIGRPLMPCNDGRGWRPDHVPSFEPVWMLATPPVPA